MKRLKSGDETTSALDIRYELTPDAGSPAAIADWRRLWQRLNALADARLAATRASEPPQQDAA